MSADLARALLASLDDAALDQLAHLLAPRLAGKTGCRDILSVKQAATATGRSARTIRRALTAGLLEGEKVTGEWQTTSAAVSVWKAAGGHTRAAPPVTAPRSPRRRSSTTAASGADAILSAGRRDR